MSPRFSPPLWQRAVLFAAGLLVERRVRSAWRGARMQNLTAWHEFLRERGGGQAERRELRRWVWESFVVAAGTRWDIEHLRRQGRQWPRKGSFVLVALGLVAAVGALGSGGFSGTRSLVKPLPYAEPEQVMVLTQKARNFGTRVGLTAEILRVWRSEETGLEGPAAYLHRDVEMEEEGWRRKRVVKATLVSPDFFTILGVRMARGAGFSGNEEAREVVLAWRFWKSAFGGRETAIGRQVTVNGMPHRIVGVAERGFWFLAADRQMWVSLSLKDPPPAPAGRRLILGGVARLENPQQKGPAERRLRAYAARLGKPTGGRLVELWPLQQMLQQPLLIYGVGIVGAAVAAVGLSALLFWQAGRRGQARRGSLWGARPSWEEADSRGRAKGRTRGGGPWREWGSRARVAAYFLLKTLAALMVCAALWLETTTALRRSVFAFNNMGAGWLMGWTFFLSCAGVLYWAWRDQQRRCPVCLRRLSMPVRIGSWGSFLFEPAMTELLCEKGHGSLSYAEMDVSGSETNVWQPMDESWRDLFVAEEGRPRR